MAGQQLNYLNIIRLILFSEVQAHTELPLHPKEPNWTYEKQRTCRVLLKWQFFLILLELFVSEDESEHHAGVCSAGSYYGFPCHGLNFKVQVCNPVVIEISDESDLVKEKWIFSPLEL